MEFIDGGKPKNCEVCWSDEENGYRSKRLHYNHIIQDYVGKGVTTEMIASEEVPDYPFDFQVILSNACNLKCRSCGSSHSTEWYKELLTMSEEDIMGINNHLYRLPHGQAGDKNGEFISSMEDWLPHVKRIEIVGGEPFYTKHWENAWDFMIEKGVSKDIILNMSSNATICNEPLIRKLIDNFKNVGIGFSIDGMGTTFEYLRKNGKWDVVVSNILKFKKIYDDYKVYNKVFFNYTYTTSWINAWEFPEFYQWVNENTPNFYVWPNIIHSPKHMCLYMLPKETKDRIKDKWLLYKNWGKFQKDVEGMITFMYSIQPTDEEIKNSYKKYTLLDSYRKESTFNVVKGFYPELEKYF
jgi:MoaA/NifB/PqqE/SkfB family radical SAM enzyme